MTIKSSCTKIIFLILTAMCMVVIFLFSSENSDKSSSRSGGFSVIAAEILVDDFDSLPSQEQTEILDRIEHIIRKIAHFSIYASLGFCASCAAGKRRLIGKKTTFTLAFCFVYACSDELHQYFVPGRACLFTDVLIDTAGALTGILVSTAIMTVIRLVIDKKHHNAT